MEYFTHASITIPMSEEAAQAVLNEHQRALSGDLAGTCFEDWDDAEVDTASNTVEVSAEEDGVWLRSSQGFFDNQYAAALVSAHLEREGSGEVITWTYALTASRPVPDAFGGGVVAVSAKAWTIIDASSMAEKAREQVISEE